MTEDEAVQIIKMVKGLFPEATVEKLSLIREQLPPFRFVHAETAIKAHAKKRQWLDIPQLIEALRSDAARHAAGATKESRLDLIRRTSPNIDQGAPAHTIIGQHYRAAWMGVLDSRTDPRYLSMMRRLISNHAFEAMMDCKYSRDDSQAMADWCVSEPSADLIEAEAGSRNQPQ